MPIILAVKSVRVVVPSSKERPLTNETSKSFTSKDKVFCLGLFANNSCACSNIISFLFPFVAKSPSSSNLSSRDIGPGNCLIDSWVRKNSDQNFDKDGILAATGTRNEIILEQAQELFSNRPNQNNLSFDVNDFDVSFARGLSLEDGATTLTDFTARVIGAALFSLLSKVNNEVYKVLICGGGRKNKVLLEKIKKNTLQNIVLQPIDDYGIDGDFVESQAFAFLAIRSILKLPISFPETTGCSKPTQGGVLVKY